MPPAENGYAWGFNRDMHLDETSRFATPAARDKACHVATAHQPLTRLRHQVYSEWRRYWDVSKPILIEKSPRHILMTRLLQHWFTPEQTLFVVVLRHPV